jgi:ribonuclease P protein component
MESDHAEENLSAEQSPTRQKTRIPRTHGNKERPRRAETTSGEGPKAPGAAAQLSFDLPKEARLRKRAEFLRVYEKGTRIDGRYMTVFILPNSLGRHRAGITATRKAIGKANERNRAKRLLRESFRLNRAELDRTKEKYDWVLNARRSILSVKLEKPLEDFRSIVGQIASKTSTENTAGHDVV